MPLQMPELALTVIAKAPVAVGIKFAGVHVRPAVTAVPLQVAAGAGEIATPTVPVVAVIAQAKVGAELLLGATLDELGGTEELDGATELLLGIMAMLEELSGTDELNGTTEPLLGAMATLEELGGTDELKGTTEPLLGTMAMLEELSGTEELLTNTAFDELLPAQD